MRPGPGPDGPDGARADESDQVIWCDSCDRQVGEEELTEDGACPDCGADLLGRRPIPLSFKLMGIATVIYLIWRLYQLVEWLIHHFAAHHGR